MTGFENVTTEAALDALPPAQPPLFHATPDPGDFAR